MNKLAGLGTWIPASIISQSGLAGPHGSRPNLASVDQAKIAAADRPDAFSERISDVSEFVGSVFCQRACKEQRYDGGSREREQLCPRGCQSS